MRGFSDAGKLIIEVPSKNPNINVSEQEIQNFVKKCLKKCYPSRCNEDITLVEYSKAFSHDKIDIQRQEIVIPDPSEVTLNETQFSTKVQYPNFGKLLIPEAWLAPKSKVILFRSTKKGGPVISNLYRSRPPYTQLTRLTQVATVDYLNFDESSNTMVYKDTYYKDELKIIDANSDHLHTIDLKYLGEKYITSPIVLKSGICLLKEDNDFHEILLFNPKSLTFYHTGINTRYSYLSNSPHKLLFKNPDNRLSLLDLTNNVLFRLLSNGEQVTAGLYSISQDGSIIVFSDEEDIIHVYDIEKNAHSVLNGIYKGDTLRTSSDCQVIITRSYQKMDSELSVIFLDERQFTKINFPRALIAQAQISDDKKLICFLKLPSRKGLYGKIGLISL